MNIVMETRQYDRQMLILASQSQSRKDMLLSAGVIFEAVPAAIDERALENELSQATPVSVASALAEAKAVAVSTLHPHRWVLGSDSLITVDTQRFNKPVSREDAADHLRYFSGRQMILHSAATLVHNGKVHWEICDQAVLSVRTLEEPFIMDYLDHEWPAVSQCVGVFRIEGRGVQLFDSIDGSHFTVLGMPLLPVLGALRKFEVQTA